MMNGFPLQQESSGKAAMTSCSGRGMRNWMPGVLAVVLVLSIPFLVHACPTCKEGLASGGNSPNLVRGFGWSIIFMLSMPFLILGGLGSYFYLLIRREQARKPQIRHAVREVPTLGIG
jgi:hypothetical protein